MELDILAGWTGALNDSWNVDVGVMQYRYPKGDNAVDEFNFYEGYAKFFYDSWTLGVAYSPIILALVSMTITTCPPTTNTVW